MFSVVSSRFSAQTVRIVGFVYLLFYRYWGAGKNIIKSIFWPMLSGSGLRAPSLDISLAPRKYFTGFKTMEAPVLCGSLIYWGHLGNFVPLDLRVRSAMIHLSSRTWGNLSCTTVVIDSPKFYSSC